MKKLKILNLLLSFWVGAHFASETKDPNSEFEKFTTTYRLPKSIEKFIKNNTQGAKVICYQTQSPLLYFLGQDPIYCSKGDEPDRIKNAERLRNRIKENNLNDYLTVPKKYIYNNNGAWEVVVEGIQITDIKKLTHQEVNALIKIQEEMCYTDLKFNENIVRDQKTGKITIIDTEDRSFSGGGLANPFMKHICVRALFTSMDKNKLMDPDTRAMLAHRIDQDNKKEIECLRDMDCRRYPDGHVECQPKNNLNMPISSSDIQSCEEHFRLTNFVQEAQRFDKDGIDHEQVKKKFDELRKRRRRTKI